MTSNAKKEETDSVMIDPSSLSVCGTPPKKRWEMSFNAFLRGKTQQQQSSNLFTQPSSPSTGSGNGNVNNNNISKGMKKKSSFSLIPGSRSRRLVSRSSGSASSGSASASVNGLTSVFLKPNTSATDELDMQLRNGIGTLGLTNSSPNSGSDYVIRQTQIEQQQHQRQRQNQCSDCDRESLTGSLLNAQLMIEANTKATAVPTTVATPTTATSSRTSSSTFSKTNKTNSTDAAFDSSLKRIISIDWLIHPIVNEGLEPSSGIMSTPSLMLRSSSDNLKRVPQVPSINNHHRIPSSLTDCHDVGLNLEDEDDDERHHSSLISYNQNQSNLNYTITETDCGIPEPPESIDDIFRAEGIENVVTVCAESFSSNSSNFQRDKNLIHNKDIGTSRLSASPETKKAFTKIHNSTKFNQGDSIVNPFLAGMNRASNVDLVGSVHNSYVSHYNTMLIGRRKERQQEQQHFCTSIPRVSSTSTVERTTRRHQSQHKTTHDITKRRDKNHEKLPDYNATDMLSKMSKSLPLERANESRNKSIQKNYVEGKKRLLKPILGADSWMQGRRYLILPAVLASCPVSTINSLSGLSSKSAAYADLSSNLSPNKFGVIVLGGAQMTYVGDKYHLTCGEWSSCKLVLRQNYVFEYDLESPLSSLPRGLAHLQHAVASPHKGFQDALELRFYASPCAKVDYRVLIIRVQNSHERDQWIYCLNSAAKLQIKDIWDYDESFPIGTGRYASIYSARRRSKAASIARDYAPEEDGDRHYHELESAGADHTNDNYAIKIINKNEFWRLVVSGRERCDTIVREVAVQATLTAAFGTKYNNFMQIHGFFESSDKIVIEMELLEGKDLFEYISTKSVLDEDEAGSIVREILVGLSNMKQLGIAHRDIKPANIFMADQSMHGTSVKLGDFGMSAFVGLDGLLRGRCGSPGYVSPEILLAESGQGYENKIDIFSTGVTLYVMLCGYEPFYGQNEKELIEANKHAEIEFPKSEWGGISREARDLVERMLKRKPVERITAREALEHDWIIKLQQQQMKTNVENIYQKRDFETEGICTVM